jgi:hypothetical protein
MAHSVAWFIRHPEDRVKRVGTSYYGGSTGLRCDQMFYLISTRYSIETDPNPEGDFCRTNNNTSGITADFVDHISGLDYSLTSVDFVGGRPPTRPTS